MCHARGGPRPCQKQLTQTLIVLRLMRTFVHRTLIMKSQQKRIEVDQTSSATTATAASGSNGGSDHLRGSSNSLNSAGALSSHSSSARSAANRPLTAAELRLNPGVIKRVPPTGESGSPKSAQEEGQTTKMKTSMRAPSLPTGGDTGYGPTGPQASIGLAPPLSKIIMSSNLQVVQVEHHSDSDSSRATPKQRHQGKFRHHHKH